MAASLDLYSCDICMENMLERNPKGLSCLHSFCSDCLKQLIKQGTIECPTCRVKTVVPGGDVTGLPPNFMLQKFKEQMDHLLSVKHVICVFCKSAAAILKCRECSHLMCDGCIQMHNKLKTFADHKLYKLCSKHPDGMVAHICVKCVQPVCSTCILMEHAEHETNIRPYQEGLSELLSDIEKTMNELQIKEEKYIERKAMETAKLEGATEAGQILNKMIEYHSTKLNAAKENLRQIKDFIEKENVRIKEHQLLETEINNIKKRLTQVSGEIRDEDIDGVQSVQERARKVLSENFIASGIPENISLQILPAAEVNVKLCELITKSYVPTNVTYLKEPILVKTVTCPYQNGWGQPGQISLVNPTSVMIADTDKNTVTIAYQSDMATTQITVPAGHGKIKDARVFEDSIYFLFENSIIKRPRHVLNSSQDVIFKPAINKMKRCLILSKKSLVLVCNADIYLYDPNSNTTRKVVSTLKDALGISLGYCKSKRIFGVAEKGLNQVNLYDDTWNKLITYHTSDNKLQRPFDLSVSPNGVIVADSGNFKVSLFDFDGNFVKHILQKDQCNGYPDGIVFNYPYIWVVETKKDSHPVAVKFFKICEEVNVS